MSFLKNSSHYLDENSQRLKLSKMHFRCTVNEFKFNTKQYKKIAKHDCFVVRLRKIKCNEAKKMYLKIKNCSLFNLYSK